MDSIIVTDSKNNLAETFLYLRNPFGVEPYFDHFNEATDFTSHQLMQIPAAYLTPNDGAFLIKDIDFLTSFPVFEISRLLNNTTNVSSTYTGSSPTIIAQHNLQFTANSTGTYFLSFDTWY